MARRHYNLPPLTTLAAFEAAARHLSFKDAAQELNVTPGAVSHQIKALEAELGTKLFLRQHRGVVLTDGGEALSNTLQSGFSDISATLAQLRRAGDDPTVTIAATTAVSSLWLTPRLARFWKEFQGIPVNQVVSDGLPKLNDQIELQLCYGKTAGDECVYAELFRDELVPLCSPELAEATTDTSLSALAQQPLIHLDFPSHRWTTWDSWFEDCGHMGPVADGVRVNNYTIALQAAREGAGVVLGWKRLVSPLLERGALVPLGAHSVPSPAGFHIASAPLPSLSRNARILRQWLLDSL